MSEICGVRGKEDSLGLLQLIKLGEEGGEDMDPVQGSKARDNHVHSSHHTAHLGHHVK